MLKSELSNIVSADYHPLCTHIDTILLETIMVERTKRKQIIPRLHHLHSVSSSAACIYALCKSACISCGSDSLRRYRSSLCGDRECRCHISSSSFSGGQLRPQWRPPTKTKRRVLPAGVQPRCICSEGMSFRNIVFANRETEPPPCPLKSHARLQVGGMALPWTWA